jgi:hypothetical protein
MKIIKVVSILLLIALHLPAVSGAQQYAISAERFTSAYIDGSSAEYAVVGAFGEPIVVTAVSNDFGINALLIGGGSLTDAETDPAAGPVNFLAGNYPNPFNPVTTIRYGVERRSHVSLRIYDVAGRLVRVLVDEVQEPGLEYEARWQGRNDRGRPVASGIYFCRLMAGSFTETRKLVLLR